MSLRQILTIKDADASREVMLEREIYTLGRARDNDIVLKVGTVSAHHAALVRKDDDYWIEDLLSTNGTFVNGRRVQRRRLEDRDTIMLADCQIYFSELVEPKGVRTKVYSGAIIEQNAYAATPVKRVQHRKGETGKVPFRSGRFFTADGQWYFATREGTNVGPFESLNEARAALVEYGRRQGFMAGFDAEIYRL